MLFGYCCGLCCGLLVLLDLPCLVTCGFAGFRVLWFVVSQWLWFCYVCWARAAGCGLAVFGVVVCFLAESGFADGCWLLLAVDLYGSC